MVPFCFFAFGLLIGIIIVSNIMNYVLKYKKHETYLCILGFAISSVLLLCMDLILLDVSIFEVLFSIILFIIGYKLSFRLNV